MKKNQKQPSRGILRKRCSENIQQIYRRTPMPKCDFNKVLGLVHWCFGIGALLSVCCIFSEHIFLRTPLDGCFWILYFASIYFVNVYDAKKLGMYFLQSKKTKSSHKNFYSFRSSHQRCSIQKSVLRNFTGKHLCQSRLFK